MSDFLGNGAAARKALAGVVEIVGDSLRRDVKAAGTLVGVNEAHKCTVYRLGGKLFIEKNAGPDDEGDMVECAVAIGASSCVLYLSTHLSTFLSGDNADREPSKSFVDAFGGAIDLMSPAPCTERIEIGAQMIYEGVSSGGSGSLGKVMSGLEVMFADTDGDEQPLSVLVSELRAVVCPLVLDEVEGQNLFSGIRLNGELKLEVLIGDFAFEAPREPACEGAKQVLIDAYGYHVATHGESTVPLARVVGDTYTSFRESETKWVLEGPDGLPIATVIKNDYGEYIDFNGDEIETGLFEGDFCPSVATAKWAAPPAKCDAPAAKCDAPPSAKRPRV